MRKEYEEARFGRSEVDARASRQPIISPTISPYIFTA
jgi:hypothetical protein